MIPMITKMDSVMSHKVNDFLDLVEEESQEDDMLVMVAVEKVEELVVKGFFWLPIDYLSRFRSFGIWSNGCHPISKVNPTIYFDGVVLAHSWKIGEQSVNC